MPHTTSVVIILRFPIRIRCEVQGPVATFHATRYHQPVHPNNLPVNGRGDVKGSLAVGYFAEDFQKGVTIITTGSHMLPIRTINFFANLAIKPMRCILSSRHYFVVRAGGTSQEGENGRHKEETGYLQF